MKKYLFILLLPLMAHTCEIEEITPECEIHATVVDMTGLDGCGFILQGDDGKKYEPVRIFFCGTPDVGNGNEAPSDPLAGFEFHDGQRVKFSFKPFEGATICMAGTPVFITCITELSQGNGR